MIFLDYYGKGYKEIGQIFSNEVVEISTIHSRSITSDTQEFSFKLRLLTAADEDVSNIILPQASHLIGFFKIYLLQENSFKIDIKVPKESEELYNNYRKANSYKTVEEFISKAPTQIFLQGITITLQTDVKNIKLDNLHQIEVFLNEQLKHAEKTKSEEQSQDMLQAKKTESKTKNAVHQENVQVKGSFGYDIKNKRKQVTCTSIAGAAMHENFSWFRSFSCLPNFFNTAQFFSPQLPKISIQSNNRNLVSQEAERDIGKTRSHTDYFKANRKKKAKKQAKELSKEEKQSTIKQAQVNTRLAMIDNVAEHKEKKLDEIFVEVVSEYKNQNLEIFHNIFNSVFNIVYFQDKQLHEILESDAISEVLEILKIPQPTNKSFCPKEYLQKQTLRKKQQLLKLVSGITIQQLSPQHRNISHEILPNKAVDHLSKTNEAKTLLPTNIRLKSPLKMVFSSKETYFCLFLVAASISALCLWHLPLEKVSILKELVPAEKRENIGLVLNIGLPILITLCLAYFIYSEYREYSINSIEVCGHDNHPLHL